MKIDPTILDRARAEITALDFTADIQEIARIEAGIADCVSANERARQRINELGDLRRAQLDPDGAAIADALLAGAEAKLATRDVMSTERIDQEQAALRSTQRELAGRIEGKRGAIDAVRKRAQARARDITSPVVDAIFEQAKAAAAGVAQALGAIDALGMGMGVHLNRPGLRDAVSALIEARLVARGDAHVGEDISALASLLSEKNVQCASEERRRAWAESRRKVDAERVGYEDELSALAAKEAARTAGRSAGLGRLLGGGAFSA